MEEIDEKIFYLIDILKQRNVIRFNNDFYKKIGILQQNGFKIKKGKSNLNFTVQQIYNICNVYNVNANWFFGKESYIFYGQDGNLKTK